MGSYYSTPGSSLSYNVDDGYLEARVRGYRGGLLTRSDYANLTQCETVDDLKVPLANSDYGDFLAGEHNPEPGLIRKKCMEKLALDFNHLRVGALHPLAKFMDYIKIGYMIDNVVLLISGHLNGRDPTEQLEAAHPLGMFDSISAVTAAETLEELYKFVLVETPLGPYFKKAFPQEEGPEAPPPFGEINIEIVRETLYKVYYEDFYRFCKMMGGETAEVMCELLEFEADRRAIIVTINSFLLNTEMSKDDRRGLYPRFGKLWPEGTVMLAAADNKEQVVEAMKHFPDYARVFEEEADAADAYGDSSLEDAFKRLMVKKNVRSFEQQFHYGVFWSWLKLKEHEADNIQFIADAITYKKRQFINDFIPVYE